MTERCRPTDFNTSPSARSFMALISVLIEYVFQYQSLREGLRSNAKELNRLAKISIPAPPRGASKDRFAGLREYLNFNTSPSTRGFPSAKAIELLNNISIPAPPRGASGADRCRSEGYPISIPAPPRGASEQPLSDAADLRNFNTSPSTRGFLPGSVYMSDLLFQYQPLHEGLLCQPIAVVPP